MSEAEGPDRRDGSEFDIGLLSCDNRAMRKLPDGVSMNLAEPVSVINAVYKVKPQPLELATSSYLVEGSFGLPTEIAWAVKDAVTLATLRASVAVMPSESLTEE